MTPLRILMIDENTEDQARAIEAFSEAGMQVTVCDSAIRSLDIIGRERFDFVLIATKFAYCTGEEMADRVQNCFPGLPLSIMSENGTMPDDRHCSKVDMKKLPCFVAQVVGS